MYKKEDIWPKTAEGLRLRRVGAVGDGGYVIPDSCIPKTRTLLSLGLSLNWSFDDEFKGLSGCRLIGVDGSLSPFRVALRIAKRLADTLVFRLVANGSSERRWRDFKDGCECFWRLFVRKQDDEIFVFNWVGAGQKPGEVTVEQLLEKCPSEPLSVFLKMDIEGAEFEAIRAIPGFAWQINGLAVEFHDLINNSGKFKEMLDSLRDSFEIVHVHGNNNGRVGGEEGLPDILEMTFINRDLLKDKYGERVCLKYPIEGLDAPCRLSCPDITIEFAT